jgi:uncharacterized protein YciI
MPGEDASKAPNAGVFGGQTGLFELRERFTRMAIFVVQYGFSPASSEGRDRHRSGHRAWLQGLAEQRQLHVGGPYPDGSGAMVIVEGDDTEAVRTLFEEDPFVVEDLVDSLSIVEWVPAMGKVGVS